MDKFNQSEEIMMPESFIEASGSGNKSDEITNKISDLSKKGYQLIKENDIQGAKKAFNEILEIEENNNYALVGLGDTERKLNHFNDAITYYKKCLEIAPMKQWARNNLAYEYYITHQYEKAEKEYRKYQVKTLSPVEQAYLDTIKKLEKEAKEKSKKDDN